MMRLNSTRQLWILRVGRRRTLVARARVRTDVSLGVSRWRWRFRTLPADASRLKSRKRSGWSRVSPETRVLSQFSLHLVCSPRIIGGGAVCRHGVWTTPSAVREHGGCSSLSVVDRGPAERERLIRRSVSHRVCN